MNRLAHDATARVTSGPLPSTSQPGRRRRSRPRSRGRRSRGRRAAPRPERRRRVARSMDASVPGAAGRAERAATPRVATQVRSMVSGRRAPPDEIRRQAVASSGPGGETLGPLRSTRERTVITGKRRPHGPPTPATKVPDRKGASACTTGHVEDRPPGSGRSGHHGTAHPPGRGIADRTGTRSRSWTAASRRKGRAPTIRKPRPGGEGRTVRRGRRTDPLHQPEHSLRWRASRPGTGSDRSSKAEATAARKVGEAVERLMPPPDGTCRWRRGRSLKRTVEKRRRRWCLPSSPSSPAEVEVPVRSLRPCTSPRTRRPQDHGEANVRLRQLADAERRKPRARSRSKRGWLTRQPEGGVRARSGKTAREDTRWHPESSSRHLLGGWGEVTAGY